MSSLSGIINSSEEEYTTLSRESETIKALIMASLYPPFLPPKTADFLSFTHLRLTVIQSWISDIKPGPGNPQPPL